MKATDQFVTRGIHGGKLKKIRLSPDHTIYPQEHAGVGFFVHKDIMYSGWFAIETQTGTSFMETGCTTKKECIKQSQAYIDTKPDMARAISHMLSVIGDVGEMTQDDFLARERR